MKIAIFSADEPNTTAQHFGDVGDENFQVDLYTKQKNINDCGYDLVLWVDPCNFLPLEFENFKGIKVAYFIDTHRAISKRILMSFCFDYIFVAQRAALSKFKHNNNRFWLPPAFNPKYLEQREERAFDVSFIGNIGHRNSKRGEKIRQIVQSFHHPEFKGYHFPDMLRVYQNSKIVLNATIGSELNMRFFEGIGCGAIVLTDQSQECVGGLFEEGKDFIRFTTAQDAISKIHHILDNYDYFKELALKSQEKVLQEHTYLARLQQIVNTIQPSQKKLITFIQIGLFYLSANNLQNYNVKTYKERLWKFFLHSVNFLRNARAEINRHVI